MLEADYQKKVIKKYEDMGYYVIKLMKTNKNGIPDLICIRKNNNNNNILLVEVKGQNTPVSKIQQYRIDELNSFGILAIIDRYNENNTIKP